MSPSARPAQPVMYVLLFAIFAIVLFVGHSPYLTLPFFWDELGQFVPAALDILHDGALVPHSAVPNVHPPGVMAWLALVWKMAGYSIASTRSAMLLLGALGALFCFLLAIRLSSDLKGYPAFAAILLLLADPLFYTQSMMAQLDMPGMVFTLAGLLLFLRDRHRYAALACTAGVLCKETAVLLPILCAGLLITERREREAIYYAAPCLALGAWLALLWHTTGHPLGDPGFAHYNVAYALNPVRAVASLIRRAYYLGFADLRWVGWISIAIAWKRGVFSTRAWRFTWLFTAGHVLLVSLLGGAELERYLLPVLPVIYIAAACGWTLIGVRWRNVSIAVMLLGLASGSVVNPPYPFPYENNLAMADFVGLHEAAASYIERGYSGENIYTAWPLTAALRNPQYGYVGQPMKATETSDLHRSTLSRLDPRQVDVLVLYSRTWEPEWGILKLAPVRNFLARFYEYEPQMTSTDCRNLLGLRPMMRWTRRGQWIEVYARHAPQNKERPQTIAYDDSLGQ